MTRKLLPYEHQLIDALGISEEDYLEFVAAQPIYEDCKEGTIVDARNDLGLTALIFTIVGTLLQVGAALLAPKPRAQEQQQGVGLRRDERVMPRFGFNGTQELAAYGTSIPLVYTNTEHNSRGGVRVNASLVWSAILSYGGNQFMRLLLNVGAGEIEQIDPNRIAIGQLPLRDYAQSNIWVYWRPNDYPRFNDLLNNGNTAQDPTDDGSKWRASASLSPFRNGRAAYGFSQTLAPSSNASCSITGTIPINVFFAFMEESGLKSAISAGTRLDNFSGWAGKTAAKGEKLQLRIFNNKEPNPNSTQQAEQRIRYAEAATVFLGGKFKLGSAIFRVTEISGASLDFEDIVVSFVCEEPGRYPTTGYQSTYLPDLQAQNSGPLIGNLNFKLPFGAGVLQGQEYAVEGSEGKGARVRANASASGGATVSFTVIEGGNGYKPNDQVRINLGTTNIKVQNNKFNSGYVTRETFVYGTCELTVASVQLDTAWNAEQRAVFFTKCFACIEEAFYATSTKCQSIELALKLTAYRRLSGRSSVYGSEQKNYGYSEADNGGVMRTSLFRIYFRFAGMPNWVSVPRIFAFRGSNEQSLFTYLKFIRANSSFTAPLDPKYWELRLVPVVDPSTEQNQEGYCYLIPNAPQQTLNVGALDVYIQFNGSMYGPSATPPLNKVPSELTEWDLWNQDSHSQSQFSFEQGPELVITAVNEQLLEPWANYGQLHRNMATLGVHALATTTTKDLRSVSVWVERGKKLRSIDFDFNVYAEDSRVQALAQQRPNESSSYAPDIFLDTALDDENGIGKYASIHSVDVVQLSKSKRFCRANQLFMDGVIADQRSWREFWARTAPLCLLELAKIGGRDTLIPGVPYEASTGRISVSPLPISALFTAGNILEDSYKEEFIDYGANVQDVIVTVVFRDTERNDIFPRNSTVEVRLRDTRDNDALRETIDASQYVTNRAQAVLLGKFLCLSKRYFRRSIEFKTFPTDSPIAPGSYIYVEIGLNKWNSIYSGRIEKGGKLNAPLPQEVPNGGYTGFVYATGKSTLSTKIVYVNDGFAPSLAQYEGALFVLGNTVKNKRVFRVTEVELDEEGETTVRAIEHPTNDDGSSIIGKKLVESGNFFVDNALA